MAQSLWQKLKGGWPLLVAGAIACVVFIHIGNTLLPTRGLLHLSGRLFWVLGVVLPITAIRAVLAGTPTTTVQPEAKPPVAPAKTVRAAVDTPRATPFRDDHATLEQRIIKPDQAKVVTAMAAEKTTNGSGPQTPGPKLLK